MISFEPFAAIFGKLTARFSDQELVAILDFMGRSREELHRSTLELRQQRSAPKRRNPPNTETQSAMGKKS